MRNNLTRDEAADRAALLRVLSYEVEVDLTDGHGGPGEGTFRSRTVVRFRCARPGASTHIDLTAARLLSAELNGTPVGDLDGDRLALAGLAEDNTLVVEADLTYSTAGVGLHRFVDPVDGGVYLYSQFEAFDAHRVYACFDQPDLKATFALQVEAPRGWLVVSNGAAEERPAEGEPGLWRFATTPPLPTYITALVAGPFAHVHDRHGGVDLGLYCRASRAADLDAAELFALTKAGFDFYQRQFAVDYPFAKYDQLFVAEMAHGAMENAGAVTITEDLLFGSRVTAADRERRAVVVLHELAHMWFGNLVTMRWWDDLWLNESFATYASVWCLVEATEFRDAWASFTESEKALAYAQDQLPTTHPVVSDLRDLEALRAHFDAITYAKGAAVLRQLVAWVGEEAFVAAMRGYFQAHAWGNSTLADLLGALERVSGRDLTAWSREWLTTAGVATLRPVVESGPDGRLSRLALAQEAPAGWPTLRAHRLAVGFYDVVDGRLTRTGRVDLDVSGALTEVPEAVGRPRAALLLPNDGDLAYAKVRLDEESLRCLTEHGGTLDDPLARAMCWAATWDMTRDGELAARDFLALVLRGAPGEGRVGALRGLLGRAAEAVADLADPAWSPIGQELLAAASLEALRTAEPGSDAQLVWTQSLVGNARSPHQLAVLHDLLGDQDAFPGLVVDQDLRWRVVERLVTVGALTEPDLAREEAADRSAVGVARAAGCRAAIPTAEAKRRNWDLLLDGDGPPPGVHSRVIAGFNRAEHRELLAPYVEEYFEAMPRVWAERGPLAAHALVTGLFPRHALSEDPAALVEEIAAAGGPEALVRLLREGADGVRRCLLARRRDAAAG